MNLRGCPGRLPARLRESTALSPKQSLSPFPTTCTHPRPLPAHTMYTRAHATPPSRRGARRGSGGQLGRWNVRSCRCQTCLLQRASGRIPDSSEPRSPHLECKQQERDVRPPPRARAELPQGGGRTEICASWGSRVPGEGDSRGPGMSPGEGRLLDVRGERNCVPEDGEKSGGGSFSRSEEQGAGLRAWGRSSGRRLREGRAGSQEAAASPGAVSRRG